MAWTDRLREAAYTAPSGTRLTFQYENVSYTRDKKTTAFEFPDADGTYVQESGSGGRRYPMRCFFWGADYDQEADAFEAALFETGTGVLDHPIYGRVDVVPSGTVRRTDDLKTAANQATVEVTFIATIGLVYPTGQADPASEVQAAVGEFNAAAATEFESNLDLASAVDVATFKNQYGALLDEAQSGLSSVAAAKADVEAEFNAIYDSIDRGIDILVSQPLTLAAQTAQLIQAPARALAAIQARLDAYGNLTSSIIDGNGAGGTARSQTANEFQTQNLYASSYITGSILSSVNNQFTTRSEAIEAATVILEQAEAVNTWRDDNLTELEIIDTGAAYQQLQEAVALAAGFLVQISFTLKQERRITLDRNRTIIDLAAELYGSVDDQLDFLIASNNLSGSEILELPRGREIAYYV